MRNRFTTTTDNCFVRASQIAVGIIAWYLTNLTEAILVVCTTAEILYITLPPVFNYASIES